MALGMKMGGLSGGLPDKAPIYTGEYSLFGDDKKGYMMLKSGGTLSFKRGRKVDIFMLSAGQNGFRGGDGDGGYVDPDEPTYDGPPGVGHAGRGGSGGKGGLGGASKILMNQSFKGDIPVVIGSYANPSTSINGISVSGTGTPCKAFNGDFPEFANVTYAQQGQKGRNGSAGSSKSPN